jgi:glutamate-1-semialdehyde 2,1-aminomutase
MGLRSVILGYANKEVNDAAINAIIDGNNLTRPSNIELELAQKLVKNFKHVDMVKFCKNSSNAVTAAVKISRAYNQKNIVLRCNDHPFFSFDDWFISSTSLKRGIPKFFSELIINFKYNDIENLKNIIKKNKNNIACLVMEASTFECPKINNLTGCCQNFKCQRNYKKNHYLKEVQNLCRENKIIFIIDETITGFRWHKKGAVEKFDLDPDLVIYGKAIANGFSLSVLGGKKNIMSQASITKRGLERVFFLSSTHGGEMCSLAAANKTIEIINKTKVIENIWDHGQKLIKNINQISKDLGMINNFYLYGVPCSPYFQTIIKEKPSFGLRTLILKELVKYKILMPWISISGSHNDKNLKQVIEAIKKILIKIRPDISNSKKIFSIKNKIKPVFRKYN